MKDTVAYTKEFVVPVVYGVTGREEIEGDQLWEVLHRWGRHFNLMSHHYREMNRGIISEIFSAFREDKDMARWDRLTLGPDTFSLTFGHGTFSMIDGWIGKDYDYVAFLHNSSELSIVGISKVRGKAAESQLLLKMKEEISKLQEMLVPYNEREGAIQAGAKTIGQIEAFSPLEFESFVAELFRKSGWTAALTKRSSDSGVDIIVTQGDIKAIVQCKRWKKNVGQPVIRDVLGAMIHEGADEAYVLTTSGFTKAAVSFCEGKPMNLVDRIGIMEWVGKEQGWFSRQRSLGRLTSSLAKRRADLEK